MHLGRRPLVDVTRPFTAADLTRLRNHLGSPNRPRDPASSAVFGPHMERWRGAQAAVGLCLCNVETRRKQNTIPNDDIVTNINIEPSILLTVRGSHLRHHAGECSLPGGKVDPDDGNDPCRTFLRELYEEVGIGGPTPENRNDRKDFKDHNGDNVQILGQLDALRSTSGLDISVFVAFLSSSPSSPTNALQPLSPLSIDTLCPLPQYQSEVAHIFSLPFESVLDPQRQRQAYFRQNPDFPYIAIDVSPETADFTETGRPGRPSEFRGLELWGLSGWIVSSFLKTTRLI